MRNAMILKDFLNHRKFQIYVGVGKKKSHIPKPILFHLEETHSATLAIWEIF